MHTITIFKQENTYFAREGSFVLPLFDEQDEDEMWLIVTGATMLGGRYVAPGLFSISVSVVDLAAFLSTLHHSLKNVSREKDKLREEIGVLAKRWVRRHVLKRLDTAIPFMRHNPWDVDWLKLASDLDNIVRTEFPLCA
jgi:hypothetical protein